jgi:hypothetical protein
MAIEKVDANDLEQKTGMNAVNDGTGELSDTDVEKVAGGDGIDVNVYKHPA